MRKLKVRSVITTSVAALAFSFSSFSGANHGGLHLNIGAPGQEPGLIAFCAPAAGQMVSKWRVGNGAWGDAATAFTKSRVHFVNWTTKQHVMAGWKDHWVGSPLDGIEYLTGGTGGWWASYVEFLVWDGTKYLFGGNRNIPLSDGVSYWCAL